MKSYLEIPFLGGVLTDDDAQGFIHAVVAVSYSDSFYAAIPFPVSEKEDLFPHRDNDGPTRPADGGRAYVLWGGVYGEDFYFDSYPAKSLVFLVHVKG